ncbi:MAG: transposase [Synergistaceae bacterium]|nr:transposase [Synergistaceae bacterium]
MKKFNALSHTRGYWDETCMTLSPFLWLPSVRTLDSLNYESENLDSLSAINNSWFESEFHSLPYSAYYNAKESEPHEVLRSRKIRIYPDSKQQDILNQWLGTARYVFNRTLEFLTRGNNPDWLEIKRWLLKDLPDWAQNVPYQIKSVAVRDACISYKQTSANNNSANFRARRDARQTLYIPKSSVGKRGIYSHFLGKMTHAENIPVPEGDCRLTYEAGRWFICVPVKISIASDKQGRAVSLDPGIRNFMTFYSLDSCGKIGRNAFSKICSLCVYLDDLYNRMNLANHRQRAKMKKAYNRLYWRIMNLTEELTRKAALFIVKNFDVIALPEFNADMTEKFYSRTMREMLTRAHSEFQDFIRAKAEQYGRKIIAQNEDWTSQTCSWNGEIKSPGKFIRDGNITLDRDYNGARGIFLRALRESAIPPPVSVQGVQRLKGVSQAK